jgi:tetratricopeptide (TPR) repeat protein
MRATWLSLKSSSQRSPEEAIDLADAIGDEAQVETRVRTLLKRSPKDKDLRYRLAEVLHRRLKIAEAEEAFLALNREYPHDVEPYLVLSDLESVKGNKAATWDYIKKGIAANSAGKESIPNLLLLARRYVAWHDRAGAENVLHKALSIVPDEPQVLLSLAMICHETKRDAESRQILNGILKRDPQNLEAKRQLVYLIAQDTIPPDDMVIANRLLKDIFQSGNPVPEDFSAAGRVAENKQEWIIAAKAYGRALTDNPELLEARYRLAQVYKRLGQMEYSRQQTAVYAQMRSEQERRGRLIEARSLAPLSGKARYDEAQFAEKTHDYPSAVAGYDLAVRLAPQDRQIRTARARFYEFLGWKPPIS